MLICANQLPPLTTRQQLPNSQQPQILPCREKWKCVAAAALLPAVELAEFTLNLARDAFRAAADGLEWAAYTSAKVAYEAVRQSVNGAFFAAQASLDTARAAYNAARAAIDGLMQSPLYKLWQRKLKAEVEARTRLQVAQTLSKEAKDAVSAMIKYNSMYTQLEAAREGVRVAKDQLPVLLEALGDIEGLFTGIAGAEPSIPIGIKSLGVEVEIDSKGEGPPAYGYDTHFNVKVSWDISMFSTRLTGSGTHCHLFRSYSPPSGRRLQAAGGVPWQRATLRWRTLRLPLPPGGAPGNSSMGAYTGAGGRRKLHGWDAKVSYEPLDMVLEFLQYAVQSEIKRQYSRLSGFLGLPNPDESYYC
jgi:hypothetical protein